MLSCQRFLNGDRQVAPGVKEIDWFDERGEHLSPDDWGNPEARALVMRRAARLADGRVEVATLLLNGAHAPIAFRLPPPADFVRRVLVDSGDPQVFGRELGGDEDYEVQDRAAVLLIGEAAAS